MSEPLIRIRNLSVKYGRIIALQNASGHFFEGSLTAVAGPNGSGKSTLLKVLAGVVRPTSGDIVFAHSQKPEIAYLSQTSQMQRDFPITVEEVVLTGFYPKLGDAGKITATQHLKTHAALEEVGLRGYEARSIDGLSGGEFQRMLFARVMVQDAPIILLDEPFSAVDAATTTHLIHILLKWHQEGRTVICVLHDLLLIKKYFPESMVLHGKCLSSGHTHNMFEQKLLSFDLDMAEIETVSEHHKHVHDGRCKHEH